MNRAWLPGVTIALGFYTALALYNFCLIVGPAIAQGIEVPWAPSLGTMWNPAELMPDASWLVWAVLSIVLQLVAVLLRGAVRWVALGLSVASVCLMGDLARWSGPYAALAAILGLAMGTGPALVALMTQQRAKP